MAKGKLIFKLHGQKLAGLWELVRISKPGEVKQEQWLLLKKRGDAWARPTSEYDVITALPDSVVEKPLGPVEEREPRAAAVAPRAPAPDTTTDMQQAVEGPLPAKLAPQLATLASAVPSSGNWIVETNSTVTACWRASTATRCGSSLATAATGRPSSRPSPRR
jgi:bifunctional non-homologous end joining protein LigD